MKKTLILIFNRTDGKTSEMVISEPREDVTKAEVDAFVTKVRETKFFLNNAMEQTILTAISAVGFPIVVTFYLLTRFQRSMDNLTDKIGELIKELQRH